MLAGSPASGGGLQAGDRIKKINRREIEGIKGARAALATAQPGDVVRILVRRGSGTDHRDLELEPHRRGGTLTMEIETIAAFPEPRPVRPRLYGRSAIWTSGITAVLAFSAGLAETTTCVAFDPQAPGPAATAKGTLATKADKADQSRSKATVSFEMLVTNHMLVDAKINGKGPFRLIFDLGAPVTLLSNRASEAAGVVKPDAPKSFLFGMRGEAEVNRLQVGDLTADKLPVIVLDHPVLSALEDVTGRKIDGIMGFTFFARFKTTIDYHAREMSFEPITYQVRNLLKELPDRLMGPKVAQRRVVAPSGLWGLRLGEQAKGVQSQGAADSEGPGRLPCGPGRAQGR